MVDWLYPDIIFTLLLMLILINQSFRGSIIGGLVFNNHGSLQILIRDAVTFSLNLFQSTYLVVNLQWRVYNCEILSALNTLLVRRDELP